MKVLIVSVLLNVCVLAWGQPRYSILNLEALGAPANQDTFGKGINLLGEVVGSYWTPGQGELRVFTYSNGIGMMDLGDSLGGLTRGTDINDSGQMAVFGTQWGGSDAAYRYTPGQGLVSLGSLGGQTSEAQGINNRGQVTGFSELPNGMEHAFRYTDGVGMEDLGSLYGGDSVGRAINDLGWVTGNSDGQNMFLYRDDVGMTYLGEGIGWAINDQGAVAGEALGQAFVFLDGQMQPLRDFGGPSAAIGMNNGNEVVGYAVDGQTVHAFVWNQTDGMLDLNTLIDPNSGWYLAYAEDINDAGQIVGFGNYNGKTTAFRLDPVPEPSTWALLGLGGSLAFVFCRKRQD